MPVYSGQFRASHASLPISSDQSCGVIECVTGINLGQDEIQTCGSESDIVLELCTS